MTYNVFNGTLNPAQSTIDSEGWFSSDQMIFLTMFCVFFGKKSIQHLSEKMQFPGFLFPQVVQKH